MSPSPWSGGAGEPMTTATVMRLSEAAHTLPPQLAAAARFVADDPFDAASVPMRALARKAGQPPATFTRLARALGMSGWDELRAVLLSEVREDLQTAREAPFSSRMAGPGSEDAGVQARMFTSDRQAIAELRTDRIEQAATVLERAPRVLVAGFRSCHAPALLFHYLYRLFRPDVTLIGGAGGALDLDLGGLQRGDAVLLIGFAPYSRDGLLTATTAVASGCSLVAVVDRPDAPLAEGASATLVYGADSPGYFPSLTSCIALLQALAATLYARAGAKGREQLRQTEARIARHTAYIP